MARVTSDLWQARDASDPRRSQLARASDARRRPRRAGVRRARRGCLLRGRRRAALRRLGAVVGAARLRPRRSRDRRRGRGRDPARNDASAPRPRRRCCSQRRSSTRFPSIEMVRMVSSGTEASMSAHPARARDHESRPGAQVRRLLPRPCRPAARERRLGDHDARDPLDARGADGCRRRHDRRRVQRCRRRRGGGRPVRRGARRDHRRARRRQHGVRSAGARLPRGAARAVRRERGAPRLRRGDDRVPRRPRRRPGALRRDARI